MPFSSGRFILIGNKSRQQGVAMAGNVILLSKFSQFVHWRKRWCCVGYNSNIVGMASVHKEDSCWFSFILVYVY